MFLRLFFLLGVVALLHVPGAHAESVNVATFEALKSAIERQQGQGEKPDTVVITSDITMTSSEATSITILRDVTIEGSCGASQCVLDAGKKEWRHFWVGTYSKVTFKNLEMKNGKSLFSRGGAVEVKSNAVVTFSKCSFKDNSADDNNGGAVYVDTNADVTFSDCSFENNAAGGSGAAIYSGMSTEVVLVASSFSGNKAGNKLGMDIFLNEGAKLVLSGSENSLEASSSTIDRFDRTATIFTDEGEYTSSARKPSSFAWIFLAGFISLLLI